MSNVSNLTVCLMGMGVTFVGLICLIFLIVLMGKIVGRAGQKEVPTPEIPAVSAAPAANRQEMIAAVAAVLAEELGADVTALRILSFKKIS